MSAIKSYKKLIEVALPLDDINAAAAREKSIRHGHPSTLHLWWARRPLAAARAVLFAQMVNDPSETVPGDRRTRAWKDAVDLERERLFQIIRDLVEWKNTNNKEVLEKARAEIRKSWLETCELNKGKPGFDPEKLPAFHDPFAGGGAIPLEAQRLGLASHASDLNPVSVLINKAMIEIPPKFAGREPVGPIPEGEKQSKLVNDWSGAQGLAEDVRRYGHWMRSEAEKRIGHLYPKVKVTADMVKERPDLKPYEDHELTVIAWLWARTVKSPNPACAVVDVPLVSSFVLSNKKGKEAWVQPVLVGDDYRFEVRVGSLPKEAKNGTKLGRGANFRCVMSGSPMDQEHIRGEFRDKRAGARLMAVVAEGNRGRVYLSPMKLHSDLATGAQPAWKPDVAMNQESKDLLSGRGYGFQFWSEIYTLRQLSLLTTLSDLVGEARQRASVDAAMFGWPNDLEGLAEDGAGAKAYGDAIAVYLAFLIDKLAESHSTICTWSSAIKNELVVSTFRRQALPMTWDYAEANPFADSSGGIEKTITAITKVLRTSLPSIAGGKSLQADAQSQSITVEKLVSTDPPYYDNIAYADLSDYFYVWQRQSLRSVLPELYKTLAVPKSEELVASAYRHGSREGAEEFFLEGMTSAIQNIAEKSNTSFPVSIYYAFKQADTGDAGTASTGWETFLEALLRAGLGITGTWPMRTERPGRSIEVGTNALASSIVLVCRKRSATALTISRRDFQRQLREQLPEALETMIGGSSGQTPIAPVDLAQAAIGPGMAIFSQYAAVLNQDGSPMSVHDALILINREITEFLTPDAGNFDSDTLFCNGWFEGFGWGAGSFGDANTLAQAKGTTVGGVAEAGVVESGSGKVRLLRWVEYPDGWDPKTDTRTPVWEAAHHMIKALSQGEAEAGALLARMPEKGEAIRQLAYHLYTLCERKKWADDARAYNELVTAWHAIVAASLESGHRGSQGQLEV